MPPQCSRYAAFKLAFILTAVFNPSAEPRSNPESQPPVAEWSRWIESVRQRALQYSDALPDFICSQRTRRYTASPETSTWQAQDVWEAELSYNQKTERYLHIR